MPFKSIRSKYYEKKQKLNGKNVTNEILTPIYTDLLVKRTHLPEAKIRDIFLKYFSVTENNVLDKEQFVKAYSELVLPDAKKRAEELATYIFQVYDKNGDGEISFEEFLLSYAITVTGDKRTKLNLAFDVYDIDGDGKLTMDEVHEVSNAVMSFLGMHVQVDLEFLMEIDKDGDKSVTREEFINTLMENEFLDTVMVPFH